MKELTLDEIRAKAEQVPEHIEKWQNILGLQNWRIRHKFEDQLSDGANAAEVTWRTGAWSAVISYLTPESVLQTCEVSLWKDELVDYEAKTVHELLHLLFSQNYEIFLNMVEKLSPEAAGVYVKQQELTEESIVIQLTRALLRGGDVA